MLTYLRGHLGGYRNKEFVPEVDSYRDRKAIFDSNSNVVGYTRNIKRLSTFNWNPSNPDGAHPAFSGNIPFKVTAYAGEPFSFALYTHFNKGGPLDYITAAYLPDWVSIHNGMLTGHSPKALGETAKIQIIGVNKFGVAYSNYFRIAIIKDPDGHYLTVDITSITADATDVSADIELE